jgi:Domain of unknown function (DUF4157)
MWYFLRSKVTDAEADSDASSSSDPAPVRTVEDRVFDLQRSVGNRAVQRMIADSPPPATEALPLHPGHSGGEKLEQSTQRVMESGFGTTFDDVRVHTDDDAARSAASLGADAYTKGRDIYFANGKYVPGSSEGQQLLAHELAHTIQQGEGRRPSEATSASDRQAAGEIAADPLEREANRASEDIAQNQRPHVTKATSAICAGIQRQPAKSPPTPDWQKRLDEMLPGGHGLVFLMNRDMQLLETFGEAKLIDLVNKIYPDTHARELVHIYGVPAIVALDKSNLDVAKARQQLEPKALQDFATKFPNAADLIRRSVPALRLINEAEATGAVFGGYAEDGPGPTLGRPYTSGHAVYVPRAQTDPVIAMSDFLFELNNAIRAPKFAALATEAAKGSTGTLTARSYAYKMAEQEVEGMLRLGETWFKLKTTGGAHPEWDKYDSDFFLAEYEAVKAGRKTKDDVVGDVLQRVYETGTLRGKTVEQYYMDDYNRLSGGK